MSGTAAPLTLGTAGHVDHGKTALVHALTGVDTDRLPEERSRGLTIVLGYAPLRLASGRQLSVIDVPGHERFVRTMVSGASGIDAFLMVIAADDGVMPQTIEHATVLKALGVSAGIVAVSKSDIADPSLATEQAAELLPGCEAIACSAREGFGIERLTHALGRLATGLRPRSLEASAGARLHVDRSFTIRGRGTVLTGTLWSGAIAVGDSLELARTAGGRAPVRVRGLQVHDSEAASVSAGQRVAVNVTGVGAREAGRGDVLVKPGLGAETRILDCALELDGASRSPSHGERVQVHHGTRETAGRLCALGDGLWQLRLERPLLALRGDRLVVRRLAPPDTLGGGVVLDPLASRHGARPEIVWRLRELAAGREPPAPAGRPERSVAARAHPGPHSAKSRPGPGSANSRPGTDSANARPGPDRAKVAALERSLREAGTKMLSEATIGERTASLRQLRADGVAVRVSGRLYAHAEVVAQVRRQIVELLEREGSTTLAEVRDALGVSRKSAQAFLEHLDSARVTRRLPDDSRTLVQRHAATR